MRVEFTKEADRDLLFWKKSGNKAVVKKIELLIENILKNPFSGIGKPEALKHAYQERFSRRINKEHRLIYKVFEEEKTLYIYSLRGHYDE